MFQLRALKRCILCLGAVMLTGCGGGMLVTNQFGPAIPAAAPLSSYVGNWSGAWRTLDARSQSGTMTVSIDNTGKMTGQVRNETTNQTGKVLGQYTNDPALSDSKKMIGTTDLGGVINTWKGSIMFSPGNFGGVFNLPALPAQLMPGSPVGSGSSGNEMVAAEFTLHLQ